MCFLPEHLTNVLLQQYVTLSTAFCYINFIVGFKHIIYMYILCLHFGFEMEQIWLSRKILNKEMCFKENRIFLSYEAKACQIRCWFLLQRWMQDLERQLNGPRNQPSNSSKYQLHCPSKIEQILQIISPLFLSMPTLISTES